MRAILVGLTFLFTSAGWSELQAQGRGGGAGRGLGVARGAVAQTPGRDAAARGLDIAEHAVGTRRGGGPGFVPPGHMPPAGLCRVWYDGAPPGRQPRPESCATAYARARGSYGARVIHGEGTYGRRGEQTTGRRRGSVIEDIIYGRRSGDYERARREEERRRAEQRRRADMGEVLRVILGAP